MLGEDEWCDTTRIYLGARWFANSPQLELARDLLDSVVEGPECDAIWEAYQGDDGDAEEERLRTANQLSAEVNVTDDEEAMAMQMHADMDEEAMEMGMSRSIDF